MAPTIQLFFKDNKFRIQRMLLGSLVVLEIVTLLPRIIGTAYINTGMIDIANTVEGAESFSCSATQSATVKLQALNYLQSGKSWTGGNPRWKYQIAVTYANRGDYDTALRLLRSLPETSSDARVQLCLGDIYYAIGSSTQAREAWIMSGAGRIFLRRAEIAIANHQRDYARNNLDLAFSFMDKFKYYRSLAEAYIALGKLHQELGSEQEGQALLAQATSIYDHALDIGTLENQDKILLRILRAQSFRERQMFALAIDDLEMVILVESTGRAYAELGVIYGYIGNWPEAIRAFLMGLNRELGSDPSAIPYWIQLGIAYRENKELVPALEVFERVVQETTNIDWQAWALTELGIVYAIQGNVSRSLSPLQNAVTLTPNWVHPRFALASSLTTLNRTSEACEQYRIIISLDSNNDFARSQMEYLQCSDLPEVIQ